MLFYFLEILFFLEKNDAVRQGESLTAIKDKNIETVYKPRGV